MIAANYTEFRTSLKKFLDNIEKNNETLIVKRKNSKGAVMISLDEYNSIKETVNLLSSKANTDRLFGSIQQINSQTQKKEVAYFMQRLYEQKLTTCSGGNISLKIDDENILITPSQLDKARLTAEQIGVMSLNGKNLTPELIPTMENGMHLSIYKKRPDVKAIVHAHPTYATSFSATNKKVNCKLSGEARFVIGEPAYAKYALMGSKKLARIVSEASINANVIVMKNHGILAVGKTLLQAFDRLEVFEAAAKITLISGLLGEHNDLSADELKAIDDL